MNQQVRICPNCGASWVPFDFWPHDRTKCQMCGTHTHRRFSQSECLNLRGLRMQWSGWKLMWDEVRLRWIWWHNAFGRWQSWENPNTVAWPR